MPRLILITALLCATACVSYEPPAPDSSYGAAPTKAIRKPILQYFEDLLTDPYSAKYRLGTPRKVYAYKSGKSEIAFQGWGIPVEVNARNGFGGYGGYEMFFALVRDGEVRSIVSKTDGRSVQIKDEGGEPVDLWMLEIEAKRARAERREKLSLQ